MDFAILQFVALGFLGGFTFILIRAESWKDLKKFKMVRRLIIGAIAGLLYFFMYSQWSFPDLIMCFVSGYMGVDFIEGLIDKVQKRRS